MKTDETNSILLKIPSIEAISELIDKKLSDLFTSKPIAPSEVDEILDVEGVQLLLGGGNGKKVCRTTVDNWRKQRILPYYKIGEGRNTTVRFRKSDVLKAMEAMKVGI